MLLTLYKFELKKLFCAKVNVIAMTGSVIMLIFLAVSSVSEAVPVSREAAEELNGSPVEAVNNPRTGNIKIKHHNLSYLGV